MFCEKCGQWIEDGSNTCSHCGASVNVPNTQNAGGTGDGMNAGQANPPAMTKKEFARHPNIVSVSNQVRSAGIACYIIAGISLVISVILVGPGAILDVLLIVGLGLGIHLGRSRVCAIILTAYGAFNMIVMTLSRGSLSGWWILVVGIYAIIYTFKYQGAWEEYQKTGNIRDLNTVKNKNK